MALVSPGVQVTIIDESFYTPAEPGTTPLIVVATAQDKSNGAGTGTATATTKANAGKAFRLTSQKDVGDLFGVPFFEKTPSNTPIHGSERNEYGLLAAYSYLGVSASAFIVRADVNLDELEGTATEPGSEPTDGAWWFDTSASAWGIFEWNGAAGDTTGGQTFTLKQPIVLTDADATTKIVTGGNAPRSSVGSIGDYCVVFETGDVNKELARVYYKSPGGGYNENNALVTAGAWVKVGSGGWAASWPTVTSRTIATPSWLAGATFYLNGTLITASGTTLASLVTDINTAMGGDSGVYAKAVNNKLYLYSNGATEGLGDSTGSGSIVIAAGSSPSILADVTGKLGITAKEYFPPTLAIAPHTAVPEWKTADTEPKPTGSVWLKTTTPGNGADLIVKKWNSATGAWVEVDAPIYDSGNAAAYYLDRSGGGANIPVDSLYVQANAEEQFSYANGTDTAPDTRDTTFKELSFRVWKRSEKGATVVQSAEITTGTLGSAGARTFTIKQSIKGALALSAASTVSFSVAGNATDAETLAAAINAITMNDVEGNQITNHVEAAVTASGTITLTHKAGGEIRLTDGTGSPVAALFTPYNPYTEFGTANFYTAPTEAAEDYIVTSWRPLADAGNNGFAVSADTPLNEPTDGQLWYNNNFAKVDIMVHNGSTWVGYKTTTSPYFNASSALKTDPAGPIVAASEPTTQSDGTPLVNGDLWISTADMENFPTIYKWDGLNLEWALVDKTDQITDQGVLFADARQGTSGGTATTAPSDDIADLLESNFLDTDAPDPALYPKGMLLWNLRRSGGNVKQYQNSYIDTASDNPRTSNATLAGSAFVSGSGLSMETYFPDRWVTASGNNEDGSGSFGRKAQRKVVTQALKSVIDTSQEIRDEERRNFNIIACPGYPETMSNLVNLNIDRGITAFVIGDTPLRLASDATSLNNWGTNAELVTDNGDDGIVTYDEYLATYYPNGFTTDLSGSNAVVPASHMMLKTIALSDNVSFPWFAPAGTRRGGITNATAVGYIDAATGEFQTVALNEGQRDTLYELKVNPIPFFNGVGLVAYGQKTRARNASALDRINVARLVVYLRSQLNKLARPYLFEPNDKITRDEIKQAAESLLLELVGLRAIYDFAVVCDESNNTPSRIDRNELYVDIAIEPVKAIEFIYIPLRIKNTGEI